MRHPWYSLRTGSIHPKKCGVLTPSSPHPSQRNLQFRNGSYVLELFLTVIWLLNIIIASVQLPLSACKTRHRSSKRAALMESLSRFRKLAYLMSSGSTVFSFTYLSFAMSMSSWVNRPSRNYNKNCPQRGSFMKRCIPSNSRKQFTQSLNSGQSSVYTGFCSPTGSSCLKSPANTMLKPPHGRCSCCFRRRILLLVQFSKSSLAAKEILSMISIRVSAQQSTWLASMGLF